MAAAPPQVLIDFARAFFDAIAAGRIDDVVASYADSPDTLVFLEGPRWQTLGFERISTGWRAFVDAPLHVDSVTWVDGPYGAITGRGAWFAGTVQLQVVAAGESKTILFRDTHVLAQSDDGAWRIVHEHVSQPLTDPYGIGDWAPAPSGA